MVRMPCVQKTSLTATRDAVQRPAILSVRQFLVSLPGLAFRHFGRDGDKGFQFGIERRDAAQ